MPTVIIVGAGISGLSLAYRLKQFSPQTGVTIIEDSPRAGGKVRTEHHDGFLVECGPNGFLDQKPAARELCDDLGLSSRLVSASDVARRNRYLFRGHGLEKLPTGLLSFLGTRSLSWRGKLNVLAERFRPAADLDDESVEAFGRRRLGDEIAEGLLDAFVTGIHAGDPGLLSLPAAFPRLARLEREHGGILKGMAATARERRASGAPRPTGQMWSLDSGLGGLIDSVESRLSEAPIKGIRIRSIEPPSHPGQNWTVRGTGKETWKADAVALTCPAPEQAAIVEALDHELAEKIGGIAYTPVAVVALGFRTNAFRTSLEGFGYLSPQRLRRDVLGAQWCSSIFPNRAPPGHVLVRALCGGWNRRDILTWDDQRLTSAVRAELGVAMGLVEPPVFEKIVRWERAIPQYHLGHLTRVAWIEDRAARYPGLFLGGNSYRGVALSDCTEQGSLLAKAISNYLERAGECEPAR